MAGIGNLFALIDQLKRNVGRNLQDPMGAIELGLLRADEDFKSDPVDTVLGNANIGGGLLGMTKLVKGAPKAPQADALETARRNAIEMLGLPENNTAMDRARAMGYVDEKADDYRMSHKAPIRDADDYAAPLYAMNRVYPDDIYSQKARQYYGDGNPPIDAQSIAKIMMTKGQPNADVRAFRAVPLDAPNYFNHGDWITLSEAYAKQHGAGMDGFKIIEQKIPAKSAYTDGNSINEFGYDRTQEFADAMASIPLMRAKGKPERSRFAAFDPARRNENNLLASRLLPLALPGLLFAGDEEEE